MTTMQTRISNPEVVSGPGRYDAQVTGVDDKGITLSIYARSITIDEHRALRRAVDAASVEGTTTILRNSAGAAVAAIIPLEKLIREGTDNAG